MNTLRHLALIVLALAALTGCTSRLEPIRTHIRPLSPPQLGATDGVLSRP